MTPIQTGVSLRVAFPFIVVVGLLLVDWYIGRGDSDNTSSTSSDTNSSTGSGIIGTVTGAVTGALMAIVAIPRRLGAWLASGVMGLTGSITDRVPGLGEAARNPFVLIIGGVVLAIVFTNFGEINLFGAFDFITLVVALLIWVWLVLRRFGFFDWRLYAGLGVLVFLFAGELIRPGSILPAIGDAIASIAPLAGLLLLYIIYDWWKNRDNDTTTAGRMRGRAQRVNPRRRRGDQQ